MKQKPSDVYEPGAGWVKQKLSDVYPEEPGADWSGLVLLYDADRDRYLLQDPVRGKFTLPGKWHLTPHIGRTVVSVRGIVSALPDVSSVLARGLPLPAIEHRSALDGVLRWLFTLPLLRRISPYAEEKRR